MGSDRKQISCCMKKEGRRGQITKGHEGTLGVTDRLILKYSDGDMDICLKLSTLMKVYTSNT